MPFTLTIELGNEAMSTCGDVARALENVAERLPVHEGIDISEEASVMYGRNHRRQR